MLVTGLMVDVVTLGRLTQLVLRTVTKKGCWLTDWVWTFSASFRMSITSVALILF